MERSTIFKGNIHYFYGPFSIAMFSKLPDGIFFWKNIISFWCDGSGWDGPTILEIPGLVEVKTFGRPCICSDYPWNHLPEPWETMGKPNINLSFADASYDPFLVISGMVSPSISAKKASMRTPPAAFAAEEMLCRCQRRHRKRPGFRMMVSNGVNIVN